MTRTKRVVIVVPGLGFVVGLNAEHLIVSCTPVKKHARVFPNAKLALAFITKYADAGYGLTGASLEALAK